VPIDSKFGTYFQYSLTMKTVSIDELKRNLSALIDQAATGPPILITKNRRPIATLSAADMEHVHIGPRFGRGTIKPLLRAPTQGKYLEVLDDDRRPPAGRR
jgi:prevent-host-death family protein